MRTFRGIVTTIRPPVSATAIPVVTAVAFLASYTIDGSLPAVGSVIWAILATWLGTVSAYAFNDYFDRENDRTANPARAFPVGDLKSRDLIMLGILFGLASMLVCILVFNLYFAAFGALGFLLIFLYSIYFKGATPWSFMLVTLAVCLMPLAVWIAFHPSSLHLIPVMIAVVYFFFEPGFTLVGVCRDIEGDRERKIPTLPVSIGLPATARFVFACWILALLASVATYFLTPLGIIYLLASLLAVFWALMLAGSLVKHPDSTRAGEVMIKSSLFFWVFNLGIVADLLY
jgi:4-hydroxybenzoate polyprenyltransferase